MKDYKGLSTSNSYCDDRQQKDNRIKVKETISPNKAQQLYEKYIKTMKILEDM